MTAVGVSLAMWRSLAVGSREFSICGTELNGDRMCG